MGIFDRLVNRLRPAARADGPQCRLSEQEALEIAAQVVSFPSPLSVVRVSQTERGVVWVISTATVGSGEHVRVDDATGEVIDSGGWGMR
jgi:hypothetical protein